MRYSLFFILVSFSVWGSDDGISETCDRRPAVLESSIREADEWDDFEEGDDAEVVDQEDLLFRDRIY